MTTSTREHQNSDEKPNKRKKISSSSNGSADNATKKTIKRSMPKPKVNANVIELTDYSSLENKDLVKIAKERKIKESPKDRTDLINTLYGLEAEEKNATIGAGILDILPDQFGFLRPPGQKNSPNDIDVSRGIIRKIY